jgi:hypothetical protein
VIYVELEGEISLPKFRRICNPLFRQQRKSV